MTCPTLRAFRLREPGDGDAASDVPCRPCGAALGVPSPRRSAQTTSPKRRGCGSRPGQARSLRAPVKAAPLPDQNTFDRFDPSSRWKWSRCRSTGMKNDHAPVAPLRPTNRPPCHGIVGPSAASTPRHELRHRSAGERAWRGHLSPVSATNLLSTGTLRVLRFSSSGLTPFCPLLPPHLTELRALTRRCCDGFHSGAGSPRAAHRPRVMW